MTRPAVFLDRDGTLIEDPGFLSNPANVVLLPGVVSGLRRLEAAGYARIVITNQSGIGRGLITEAEYRRVAEELDSQLMAAGASLTATYFCPHPPEANCECRKPGTALHRQAAAAWQIDLAASWCVGDRLTDLYPSRELGGNAALVLTGEGDEHQAAALESGFIVAPSLLDLVERRIL